MADGQIPPMIPPGAMLAAMAAAEEHVASRTISGPTGIAMAAVEAAAPLIAAAERERIREMAVRNEAVCTSDEGTGCYFADLIRDPQ
jgi:hypothetical protein